MSTNAAKAVHSLFATSSILWRNAGGIEFGLDRHVSGKFCRCQRVLDRVPESTTYKAALKPSLATVNNMHMKFFALLMVVLPTVMVIAIPVGSSNDLLGL
ncbi:hypothetical protein PM082_006663 [Marasmius tenuissimus]|nr:hypothetical protein PM082_006663 [Marasmius tenuissimus]